MKWNILFIHLIVLFIHSKPFVCAIEQCEPNDENNFFRLNVEIQKQFEKTKDEKSFNQSDFQQGSIDSFVIFTNNHPLNRP